MSFFGVFQCFYFQKLRMLRGLAVPGIFGLKIGKFKTCIKNKVCYETNIHSYKTSCYICCNMCQLILVLGYLWQYHSTSTTVSSFYRLKQFQFLAEPLHDLWAKNAATAKIELLSACVTFYTLFYNLFTFEPLYMLTLGVKIRHTEDALQKQVRLKVDFERFWGI